MLISMKLVIHSTKSEINAIDTFKLHDILPFRHGHIRGKWATKVKSN